MPTFSGTTKFWTSTNGTWEDTDSWSDSVIPEDGDAIVFSGGFSNQNLVTMPIYDVDLFLLRVLDDYTGDLGASGNPLGLTADKIVMRGSGSFWFKSLSDAGGNVTDYIICNSNNLTDAMNIDSDGSDDTVTRVLVVKGAVTIAATCSVINEPDMTFRTNPTTDARVTVPTGSFGITTANVGAGILNNGRLVTNGNQTGGRWTQTDKAITTHRLSGGGVCIYNTSATMTTLDAFSGTFDLTQSSHAKTISAARIHQRAKLLKDDDLHTLTVETDMSGGN